MDKVFLFLIGLTPLLLGACGTSGDNPRFSPQIVGASFSGSDSAWISIKWGELSRTNDGGKSWHKAKPGEDGFVQVYFLDAMRGYAADLHRGIWRSVDGGETWIKAGKIEPPADTAIGKPQQMYFSDEQNGWVVDSFSVWCTQDGGVKWSRCFPTNTNVPPETQPLRSFEVSPKVAWVSATNGKAYRTQDGRQSWQEKSAGGKTDFRDVFFIDEQNGWLAGEPHGGIYKTEDGGETWKLVLDQDSRNNIGIRSLHFLNKNDGWAAGRAYPADVTRESTRGVVFRTADGGRSWQPVTIADEDLFYTRIQFINPQEGWLVGQKNLYRTDDGGKTWAVVLKIPAQ
jgi:photosystem II stability/assembly factor-like uncharacterized protein